MEPIASYYALERNLERPLTVSVFLNVRIVFRGRSAQNFRDPGFLGIVNPENDTVYLPFKRGRNELILAVSELGGGWGFICRLLDMKN